MPQRVVAMTPAYAYYCPEPLMIEMIQLVIAMAAVMIPIKPMSNRFSAEMFASG